MTLAAELRTPPTAADRRRPRRELTHQSPPIAPPPSLRIRSPPTAAAAGLAAARGHLRPNSHQSPPTAIRAAAELAHQVAAAVDPRGRARAPGHRRAELARQVAATVPYPVYGLPYSLAAEFAHQSPPTAIALRPSSRTRSPRPLTLAAELAHQSPPTAIRAAAELATSRVRAPGRRRTPYTVYGLPIHLAAELAH